MPQGTHFISLCMPRLTYRAFFSPYFLLGTTNSSPLMFRLYLLLLLFPLLTGCELIDYHPYDTRTQGSHHLTNPNLRRIEQTCAGKTKIRFAQISDTQRWYDETRAMVADINARTDIDFVVHCGDISDFGVTKEFELQRDILQKLRVPYVVLLGNHDCLGTGADTYRYLFGDPNFSFTAGNTQFLCINTNAFEYDYSTAVPDFAYIRKIRSELPPTVTRTVVAMHAQPTSEQFNNNVSNVFQYEIKQFPGLAFCLCGHGHQFQVNDLFGDGVLYYECASAKHREYSIFTLNSDGTYQHELVTY